MLLSFSVHISNNNFHAGPIMENNDWLELMNQRATPPRQSLISRNALSCPCNHLNKILQENSKRNARLVLVIIEQMAVSIPNKSPEKQIICLHLFHFLKPCAAFTIFQVPMQSVFLQDAMLVELSKGEISPKVK